MSFSSDVKEELAKQVSKSRHCQLAELAGIIELSGRINEKTKGLELDTENLLLLNKYATLMKRAFGTDTTKALDEQDTGKILAALKITAQPVNRQTADGLLLMQTCCKRAFIRGAFMAAGSISDPNKAYHFEIVCHTKEQARQLQELLCGFDTDAKIVERKGHYVVYINSVNRKVNCETANISKTVNAAVKQIEDIRLIQKMRGLDDLPAQLREMALLRLEYPDAPLKELGGYLDPPMGKSGVNHRLRKLSAIAEELR